MKASHVYDSRLSFKFSMEQINNADKKTKMLISRIEAASKELDCDVDSLYFDYDSHVVISERENYHTSGLSHDDIAPSFQH